MYAHAAAIHVTSVRQVLYRLECYTIMKTNWNISINTETHDCIQSQSWHCKYDKAAVNCTYSSGLTARTFG